jgi:hypothetical protein
MYSAPASTDHPSHQPASGLNIIIRSEEMQDAFTTRVTCTCMTDNVKIDNPCKVISD